MNTDLPLARVSLRAPLPARGYPFTLRAARLLDDLEFRAGVTFLVGDNGSGKSTVLEAVALAAEAIVLSALPGAHDDLTDARPLADLLRLSWTRRTRRGFFLRAEDFLGLARRTRALTTEFEAAVEALRAELGDGPDFVRAAAPYRNQLAGLRAAERAGGTHARSHGERFLDAFQRRLAPGGLYLLDEPEVALSPQRVLALMTLLRRAEREGAQFLIATHSPVLLAHPGAVILDLDHDPVREAAYDDLDHVRFTRDFLSAPERFLRHLDEEE
ncbi:AAA family ATPase [Deinococcus pimensis]|uniref:AAA family ATPase n=1 Tax=Deinococcus pimensis TaxID=309888 RepID=UPI0004808E5F|nr:AAA family ATPase [Deinococcus pimensis]